MRYEEWRATQERNRDTPAPAHARNDGVSGYDRLHDRKRWDMLGSKIAQRSQTGAPGIDVLIAEWRVMTAANPQRKVDDVVMTAVLLEEQEAR